MPFDQFYNSAIDGLQNALEPLRTISDGQPTGSKDTVLTCAAQLHKASTHKFGKILSFRELHVSSTIIDFGHATQYPTHQQEAAKIGMFFTQNMVTQDDAARDLMKAVEAAGVGLALAVHNLPGGAHMHSQLNPLATRALESFIEVLSVIKARKLDQVARAVGKVWESCDAIKTAPFDDKTALTRSLAKMGKVLLDVQREVDEMRVSDEAGPSGSGAESESGSEDSLLDFDAEWSEGDMKLVGAVRALLVEGAQATVRRLMKALLSVRSGTMNFATEPASASAFHDLCHTVSLSPPLLILSRSSLLQGSLDRREDVRSAEECYEAVKGLARAVSDLVASIYPPADPEEVRAALQSIEARVKALCSLDLGAWLPRKEQEEMREAMGVLVQGVTQALVSHDI